MIQINKIIMVMVLLSPSFAAEAHTGAIHIGSMLDGVVHFFTSVDHLLMMLIGIFVVFRIFTAITTHFRGEKSKLEQV